MKRFFATIIAVLLLMLCFDACKIKSSGITIEDLKNKIKSLDPNCNFIVNETAEGSSFTYSTNYSVVHSDFTGTTDKEGGIDYLSIIEYEVDSSLLKSKKLREIMTKSSYELTGIELHVSYCIGHFIALRSLFDKESSINTDSLISEMETLFSGESIRVGDWTMTSVVNKSNETVTMNASFGK